jgi:uncharacterized OB-fold protein
MAEHSSAPETTSGRLAEFHAGLERGELQVTRCDACGRIEFPPRVVCPQCSAIGTGSWIKASGRGHVWSFVVFHKRYLPEPGPQPPYNVAIVELVEGARLFTNIVASDATGIRVGMPVEAIFERHEGTAAVRFRPSAHSERPETTGR